MASARPSRSSARNQKSSASGGGSGGAAAETEASLAFKGVKLTNFAHFVGDAIAASDGSLTDDEVKSICDIVFMAESSYTYSDVMFTCESVLEANMRGMSLENYISQHGNGCIPARARDFADCADEDEARKKKLIAALAVICHNSGELISLELPEASLENYLLADSLEGLQSAFVIRVEQGERFIAMADIAKLSYKFGLQCPRNEADAEDWVTLIDQLRGALPLRARTHLMAARSSNAHWGAAITAINVVGGECIIRGQGAAAAAEAAVPPAEAGAAPINLGAQHEAIHDALFGCSQAVDVTEQVDVCMRMIPDGARCKRNISAQAPPFIKKMALVTEVSTMCSDLGVSAEALKRKRNGSLAPSDESSLLLFDLMTEHDSMKKRANTSQSAGVGGQQHVLVLPNVADNDEKANDGLGEQHDHLLDSSQATLDLAARGVPPMQFAAEFAEAAVADQSVYKVLAQPVSDSKAAVDGRHKKVQQSRKLLKAAASEVTRERTRMNEESHGRELSQPVLNALMKGLLHTEAGPQHFSRPTISFASLAKFFESLYSENSDLAFDTIMTWATTVDIVLNVGARTMVGEWRQIYTEREDDNVCFGWKKEHRIALFVWIVYKFEFLYTAWTKTIASSEPRPRLDGFKSWKSFPNFMEQLPRYVRYPEEAPPVIRSFISRGKAPPTSSKNQDTSATAVKKESAADTDKIVVAAVAEMGKKLKNELKSLVDLSGGGASSQGADGAGLGAGRGRGRGRGRDGGRGDGGRGATAANGGGGGRGDAGRGGGTQMPELTGAKKTQSSIPKSMRCEIIPKMYRSEVCKPVLDEYAHLGQNDNDAWVCRGWLNCGRCALELDEAGRCKYGPHNSTDAGKGEHEKFVRACAMVNGVDDKTWKGLQKRDILP